MTSDGRAGCTHDRGCYALILLVTFASPRRGEATALRRCDLDLDAHVRARPVYAERSAGGMLLGPPKSRPGRRIAVCPTRSLRQYVSTCRSFKDDYRARPADGQPALWAIRPQAPDQPVTCARSRHGGDAIMAGMNVRRLAAIDMYGARGATRRRRIILAEFIAGAVVMVVFGIWLTAFSSALAGRGMGLWMAGSGLNYVPLAAYAITLRRSGALDAELAGVDTGRELRRYSILQLWIFVPLSLVVLAVRSAFGRRT